MSGVTFHGLNDWHKHLFEHLGWMVLAKNHNMSDKAEVYTTSLQRFVDKANMYIKENPDLTQNQKNDIMQLINNVKILQTTWMKC